MIGYLRRLLFLIIGLTSHLVFSRCPADNYYDVHTERCHPCSDCAYPRTPNQFCSQCQNQKCDAGKYFDKHTLNCHLCTECKPPLTPNEFCQAQCTDDEKNGRTTLPMPLVATTGIMPSTGPSAENIIIIVVCTVMGAVVVVLVILALLHWKNCLCKDKHRQDTRLHGHEHQEPFIRQAPDNGQHSVNIEMHSLPFSRSDEPQQTRQQNFSLPIHVQPQVDCNHHFTNNQNNSLHEGENSVELVDDRDGTASHDASSRLVATSTRFENSLLSQDKSLKGNVVCQPENEEQDRCQFLPSICHGHRDAGAVHGMLSPSCTRDSEQPHLSFDPNKGCGYEDHVFPNSSSIPNGFEIQTSLKSSC